MGSSSAPSRAASAPGLSSNSSSLCLCSPTAATPPLRRCRSSFSVFSRPLDPWFLFDCGFFFIQCIVTLFFVSRAFPLRRNRAHTFTPSIFLSFSTMVFLFFLRLCSVDTFRHHRHASAGGTVCEEMENTGMPCESFFSFLFSSEEEDHTLLCRISRTRQAINAAHHFAGGQHTHKKKACQRFFVVP